MRITGYIVSLIVALSASISYGSESKIGDTLILTVEKEKLSEFTAMIESGFADIHQSKVLFENSNRSEIVIQIWHKKGLSEKLKSFFKGQSSVKHAEHVFMTDAKNLLQSTNDEYIDDLWALENKGYSHRRDLDDVRSTTVVGKTGSDIGWSNLLRKINSAQETVVAVVDSGVDIDHPDLKNSIFVNEKECTSSGKLEPRPKEDRDGNGYVGDCMGWNAVDGNHRPYDDSTGHGTHVSGIIAATQSNGTGVAGVSNKVKILPVKALTRKEKVGVKARTDALVKAIVYATKMKVDVINLSLGWPASVNATYLRSAVESALDSGIMVVAAAGNNNHDAPVYPCSYEGVICVGATESDGEIAPYSNFGGAVDVLAPGSYILSTTPTKNRSRFWGIQGYDLKNGTSQAAPFVSASLAVLKGLFPGESAWKLQGRLLSSARSVPVESSGKSTNFGLIDLGKAISRAPSAVVYPSLKAVENVLLSGSRRSFKLRVPISNFGVNSASARFEVKVKKSGLGSISLGASSMSLSPGRTKILNLSGRVSSLSASSEWPVELTVRVGGVKKRFSWTLRLARDVESNLGSWEKLNVSTDGAFLNTPMWTLKDGRANAVAEYWQLNKSGTSADLRILRRSGANIVRAGADIRLRDFDKVIRLIRQDFNGDGRNDYLVHSLHGKGSSRYMQLTFWNSALRPLYGSLSSWHYGVQYAAPKAFSHWLPYESKDLGQILVPMFMASGKTPEIDLDDDGWGADNPALNHLYYLEPVKKGGKIEVRTRIIDRPVLRQRWANRLGLSWKEQIDVLLVSAQPGSDYSNMVVSTGREFQREYHVVSVEKLMPEELVSLGNPSFENLDSNVVVPLLDTSKGVFPEGVALVAGFSRTQGRVATFGYQSDTFEYFDSDELRSPSITTPFINVLAVFYHKGSPVYLYESKSQLLVYDQRNLSLPATSPIYRYSFLPGSIFSQLFLPVIVGSGSSRTPALYVDHSAVQKGRVSVLKVKASGVTRPVSSTLQLPEHCTALNPVASSANSKMEFVLDCSQRGRRYHYKQAIRF